jgi:hypothetical protein
MVIRVAVFKFINFIINTKAFMFINAFFISTLVTVMKLIYF